MTGLSWFHVVPFQFQVSPMEVVPVVTPPNRTSCSVVGTKARAPYPRGGGLVTGVSWFQVVPVQVQVSSSGVKPLAGRTSEHEELRGGRVVGERCP